MGHQNNALGLQVINAGFLEKLLPFLESSSLDKKKEALWSITNLTACDRTVFNNLTKEVDQPILLNVLEIIENSPNERIIFEAIMVIANLINEDNRAVAEFLVQHKLISHLK